MKKNLFIFLVVMGLNLGLAASQPSANAAAIPPPALIPPPTATPDPATTKPFLNFLDVTLNADAGTTIYYDMNINPLTAFDTAHATLYSGAVRVTVSTTFRAIACKKVITCSDVASFKYAKDAPPTVTWIKPSPGQIIRQGQNFAFSSTVVTDPLGQGIANVHYFVSPVAGGAWKDQGAANPDSINSLLWLPSATGDFYVRAVATDGLGAQGNSTDISVTITTANKSPSVTWTSPSSGTYISPANFTLSATAADSDAVGGGISKVEFYQDNVVVGTVSAAPWTWPLNNVPVGVYSMYAKAYDNNVPAATASSTPVTVTVHANLPPNVSITSPANNTFYYAPASDSIRVTATDDDGIIKKVELYTGSNLDSTITSAPFIFSKNGVPAGIYTLTAKAYDNFGLATISNPINITVAANLPPVVHAGNDTNIILPNNIVVLKATATDPDPVPTAMTYQWSGPGSTVTFTNGNTLNPTVSLPGSGTYPLIIKARDSAGLIGTDTINVSVWSKPAITSAVSSSGAAGQAFSYTMAASGYPTPALAAAGYPTWMTWNSATGLLSGMPPVSGNFAITLSAINSAGSDARTLNVSISDSLLKPVITSAATATSKLGSSFTYSIVSKGTGPITYSATSLPGGLIVAPATGVITGYPILAGIFTATLTAQNSLGTDSKNLVITVKSDPKITVDLPDTASVTEKGGKSFSVSANGFPAISYQWEYAGPQGIFGKIGINSPSYTIDTATLSSAGKYRVTLTNDTGSVTSKVCVLIVKPLPAPIVITMNPGAASTVLGKPATFKVKATGAPVLLYQWFKGTVPVTSPPSNGDTDLVFTAVKSSDAGVYHARVTNPFSDTTKPGTFAWSDTARLSVLAPKLFPPKASPAGGAYSTPTLVTLSNDTPGTNIFYTINESGEPTQASIPYIPGTTVIRIDTNIVLKAKSYKPGFRSSDAMTETYNYTKPGKVIRPTVRPPSPTFASTVNCTLSTVTPSAEIWYTLDGSDPLSGSPKKFAGSIPLNATTTIIAYAKASGMENSDTVMRTYTYVPPTSKVQTPTAMPPGGDFSQLTNITLSSATDSAVIWYTMDGTSPDTSKTRIQYVPAGFTLSKSANIRSVAMLPGFTKSDEAAWKFNLIPLISAAPASGLVFDKVVNVKLTVSPPTAVIHYTVDGTAPNPTSSSVYDTAAGLKFTGTTTLSAIATLDGISTKTAIFSYTLKYGQLATPSPVTANNTAEFKDSLKISLLATDGSDIYFTLNGDLPTSGSQHYTAPFIIDSTTTVQAIAVQSGFVTSKILFATYTLIPESPILTPVGGSYASEQKVMMTCSSKRAAIYYTLNDSTPDPTTGLLYKPGTGIDIHTTLTLKAVAVAGNRASNVREESYTIFGVRDTVLHPGEIYYLQGGYTVVNPDGQSANVHIRLAGADSLKLNGFDGVQYSILVDMADKQPFYPAPDFPKLLFTRAPSEKRALYKFDPSGKIYFLSAADTITVSQAGTYFMGIDVSPPVITYLGESIDAKDSTLVSFLVEDNVANLTFDLKRNDDPTRNISHQSLLSPGRFAVKLKNQTGTLKSLDVQLVASDYQLTSFYPKDSHSLLSLSQSFGKLQGPSVWGVGLNSRFPFDLISIPLALDPPLTLSDLGRMASDARMEGVAWSNKESTYMPIPATEILKPGQAYWVASHERLAALTLASAKTSPQGTGVFSIQLHHGWNQVGNPHLEKLYWPIPRMIPDVYRSSPIKGLWSYNAANTSYEEIEFLDPWRGYYVFNYLQDTTIQLSSQPASSWALSKDAVARSGVAAGEVNLAMGWGTSKTLRLGAAWSASDGLGMEDEMEVPHNQAMTYLKAVRDGRALSSDWVHLVRDGILQWKVAMGGTGDSLPPLRILEQNLPDGYETWAVSKSRSMKFKLEAGQSISASGLAQDTLYIYSGPREALAKVGGLKGLATRVADLAFTVLPQPGGFVMQLALPAQARIKAMVWGLDGSRKGEINLGPLSEGTYRFAYGSDFQRRSNRLTPGVYFVSLELHGSGANSLNSLSSHMSRKIVIGD